jgi:sodium/potassium-transporting ATPase subunit alpha
LIHN